MALEPTHEIRRDGILVATLQSSPLRVVDVFDREFLEEWKRIIIQKVDVRVPLPTVDNLKRMQVVSVPVHQDWIELDKALFERGFSLTPYGGA